MLGVALCVNVRHFSSFLKRIIILGSLLVAILIVAMPLAQDYLLPRIEATLSAFEGGNLSRATAGRNEILYAYWERSVGSAFIGAGFDYSVISRYYRNTTVAHNTWMQVFSDFGVIGFALFIVMTLPLFKLVFRAIWMFGATQSVENKRLALLRAGVAIAAAGLLLETCTLTSVFEIVFWWCAGCAVAFECRQQNAQLKNRPLHAAVPRGDRRR